jgi:hypothetical protein
MLVAINLQGMNTRKKDSTCYDDMVFKDLYQVYVVT